VRQRPQTGPLIVLVAAAGLLVVSVLTWYTIDVGKIEGGRAVVQRFVDQNDFATSANAWEPWGVPSDLLLLVVILAGIALPAATLAGALRGLGPALGAIITGALGTALVLIHVVSPPEPGEIVQVEPAAWLGLACCLAMLVGAFLWWDRTAHPPARGEN
jgi:hypothetical protein